MNGNVFALDTSNYTMSAALLLNGEFVQKRKILPVEPGELGLRQSDAVFYHTKNLAGIVEELLSVKMSERLCAVGASAFPRNVFNSYMPCFLVGYSHARCMSLALNVPFYAFSHQQGHIAAALLGADRLDLIEKPFLAFHISGGTTECIFVKNLLAGEMELICATNDLNAGQVVDRIGVLLGYSFPAGKMLDFTACQSGKDYTPKIVFKNGNPCLSGIENQCKKMIDQNADKQDVSKFCIDSVFAALLGMAEFAIEKTGCHELVYAGGVMSNSILRSKMRDKIGGTFAPAELSTDNAVGIGALTAISFERGLPSSATCNN